MQCVTNFTERFQSIRWETYRRAATNGQIASGILVTISVVALIIICTSNAQGFYAAANYQAMLTLVTVAGVSFLFFAVCSCVQYCHLRKTRQDYENIKRLEEIRKTPKEAPAPIEVTTTLEEKPIEYIKQVIIRPLLREFKEAVEGVVTADCVLTSKNIGDKLDEIAWAFKEGEELFELFIDTPQIAVSELLCFFGPGKKPPTAALRKLISAFNSGDQEKLVEKQKEYEAIMRGHDFSKVIQALKSQPNAQLMANLPKLLKENFSLNNDPLKELGVAILEQIFKNTAENKTVLRALGNLKKKTSNKDFPKEVEKFLRLVLEEARISSLQYKEWDDALIKHMLNTTFKRTVCGLLGMVARNIRILRLMFNQEMDRDALFITLDETFLVSESDDCIKRETLQREMFHLQSRFNLKRNEKERIALIALPETDTRDYQKLCEDERVVQLCFEANKGNLEELQAITDSVEVIQLGQRHHVRLVAVPISISEHPFKDFKNHEGLITVGAWLLKPFLPGLIRPKLMQVLPKMEGKNLARFEALFSSILNLLIDPIYDGTLSNSDFRPVFERVITTQGEVLAERFEAVLRQEKLSFEDIRDGWSEAIRGVAEEFKKIG